MLSLGFVLLIAASVALPAQQSVSETRDPHQQQDAEFAKLYTQWTTGPNYGSPLVDHLPLVSGIPTPKDVLGYYIGAPAKLTYYADILKYYRALAKATSRVKVETIGKSDEGRELVVVWVSSESNIKNLQHNRDNLAKMADPRGLSDAQIHELIATTKPHYHLMGGLHSGETGPSEMLMELVYRLATETSPLITQIRNNVIVSVTPAAEPDGRDRNVDWFYKGLETNAPQPPAGEPGDTANGRGGAGGAGGGRGGGQLPYWGKYVYHDNNRDINLSQISMRAIIDWYFTAHPPIIHDLHEAQALMYTYSGGPPQNPNLDPLLFAELPWFSNWELAQMTKWGMPGVYTHAFMDGWSPGYLGSVAYNHNGMMRMYETQSGREGGPGAAAYDCRGCAQSQVARAAGADSAAAGGATAVANGVVVVAVVVGGGRGGRGGAAAPSAPGAVATAPGAAGRVRWRAWTDGADGSRRRSAARMVPRHSDSAQRGAGVHAPQQHELHGDGRAVGAAAHGDVPERDIAELLHQDAQLARGREHGGAVRLRVPRPARHDQGGDVDQHAARPGDRGRHAQRATQGGRPTASRPDPTSSSSINRTVAWRRISSRARTIPTPRSRRTTTAAGRWATRSMSTSKRCATSPCSRRRRRRSRPRR